MVYLYAQMIFQEVWWGWVSLFTCLVDIEQVLVITISQQRFYMNIWKLMVERTIYFVFSEGTEIYVNYINFLRKLLPNWWFLAFNNCAIMFFFLCRKASPWQRIVRDKGSTKYAQGLVTSPGVHVSPGTYPNGKETHARNRAAAKVSYRRRW